MASANKSITLALLIMRRTWIARRSCVFVDQVEHAHCPSVVGERTDEVI